MRKRPEIARNFLSIDDNRRNLETFIGLQDLATALDFFIVIDPTHI